MSDELNSLHFQGDGDDETAFNAIESSFNVELSGEERSGLLNVGDLFDVISEKLGPPVKPKACFSSHVFYQLRDALSEYDESRRITPSTTLREVTRGLSAEKTRSLLEKRTGLILPSLSAGLLLSFASVVALLGLVSLPVSHFIGSSLASTISLTMFVLGLILAVLSGKFEGKLFPCAHGKSLRDLVGNIKQMNFGLLAKKLNGYDRDDAWRVLCNFLVEEQGHDATRVVRSTTFY